MEIKRCPICGGKPLDKWELNYGTGGARQNGQSCCGVDCSTNDIWNMYAIAMELAKAGYAMDTCKDSEMNERALDLGRARAELVKGFKII